MNGLRKLKPRHQTGTGRAGQAAFSLAEAVASLALLGVTVGAVYGAFTMGMGTVQAARDNLNATQVLMDRTEAFRSYTWEQLESTNVIPLNFGGKFYQSPRTTGIDYTGRVTIAAAGITEAYSNDLKMITVELNWTVSNRPRSKTIKTLICRDGLNTYVF